MNQPIIYQVVGGLLVLFFFYLTYMFTKTWRWLQTTMAFLVFAASIFLCVYAAMTVRAHTGWKTLAWQQQNQLATLQAEREKLLYGDLLAAVQTEPSLQTLNAQLGRILLDRGRVWKNCSPSAPGGQGGAITVSTGDEPNRISEQMILYGFVEAPAPPESGLLPETRVPRFYLAEFTVTAVTDNSVSLLPTTPLTASERNAIDEGLRSGLTWSLYETMPVDGHPYFTTNPLDEPNWSLPASEAPVFGNIDPQMIARTFEPFQPRPDNQAAVDAYQRMLQPYLRDGMLANQETDSPENVWVKVEFLKPHSVDVDSDAILGAVISSQNFFDRGRANVPLLQRGSDVEFVRGDVGVFPLADANQLIAQELAELQEFIFVRHLSNYDFAFREISQRRTRLNEEVVGVTRDTAAVTESNRRTIAQIQFREEDKAKLESDLAKFQDEDAKITAYASTMQQAWQSKRRELSTLYRRNTQLARELERIEQELKSEIDKRTLEAVQ
jgi:hypothetical protein